MIVLIIASLLGLTSVLLGAAADHVLDGGTKRFAIALHYQELYSVLIAGLGLTLNAVSLNGLYRRLAVTAWFFILGTIIFCGGLYAADRLPGAVYAAPVGGFLLMAGWLALAYAALGCRREGTP